MQIVSWCEGSTEEGSDDGGGGDGGGDDDDDDGCGAVEVVCMTRRMMGRRQGLLCSSQGLQLCRQTEVFCPGWSPSIALSGGLLPQGMKQAVVA
jgi:hypothetical protein